MKKLRCVYYRQFGPGRALVQTNLRPATITIEAVIVTSVSIVSPRQARDDSATGGPRFSEERLVTKDTLNKERQESTEG
jgi:hypothetical protein